MILQSILSNTGLFLLIYIIITRLNTKRDEYSSVKLLKIKSNKYKKTINARSSIEKKGGL